MIASKSRDGFVMLTLMPKRGVAGSLLHTAARLVAVCLTGLLAFSYTAIELTPVS